MSERSKLATEDGQSLEARWDRGPDPHTTVVLCHPHPLDGGTMNAPLMIALALRLVERRFTVLRFNFRGTGESSGDHDYGKAELLDVAAAVEAARGVGLPVAIAGWSFGAAVALGWVASHGEPMPYAGIAPPPQGLPAELTPGPKRIIVGYRDQVIDVGRLVAYAGDHAIDLVMVPGDHFFHGRGKKIADLVAEGFSPASSEA